MWKRKYIYIYLYISSDAQLCLTLCNPMYCSLPGSSVYGIFQARLLEWVVISFSRGSSWPRDQTHVSYVSSIGRQILYLWAIWEAHIWAVSEITMLYIWNTVELYFNTNNSNNNKIDQKCPFYKPLSTLISLHFCWKSSDHIWYLLSKIGKQINFLFVI